MHRPDQWPFSQFSKGSLRWHCPQEHLAVCVRAEIVAASLALRVREDGHTAADELGCFLAMFAQVVTVESFLQQSRSA